MTFTIRRRPSALRLSHTGPALAAGARLRPADRTSLLVRVREVFQHLGILR
jgi:hypothetical protein